MSFDSLIVEANELNPVLAYLGLASITGTRVIVTGAIAEGLLMMVPDILYFEKRLEADSAVFRGLCEDDIIFLENQSVDNLWLLSGITRATIIHIAEHNLEDSLCDISVCEKDLRSAVMSLPGFVKKLKNESFDDLWPPMNCKGLFLDRDGVVIEDVGYANAASNVKLVDGICDLIQRYRKQMAKVIVVTNQSGIGRGTVSWNEYDEVNARMLECLAERGQYIDLVLKSEYFEKSQFTLGLKKKSLRKPRGGMIQLAAQSQRIDVAKSIMVGDSARDLMAAAFVGVKDLYLLDSSKASDELEKWKNWPLLSRASLRSNFHQINSLSQIK